MTKRFAVRRHRAASALSTAAVLLAAACSGLPATAPAGGDAPEDYRLVAYVRGNDRMPLADVDAERLTHVNYAFANVRGGEVVLERAADAAYLDTLTALREKNPDLKVLLSVGGWSWSDGFSDAALTEAARDRFAHSAVDLVVRHGLDGLDVDWEYPGQRGQGNVFRPEDRRNFTLLMASLRAHLDAQSARDGRRYLLTIAAATSDAYLAHTDMAEVQRILDFVNLMTYDFAGAWSSRTGHHTNLFAADGAPHSAEAAVDRFVAAGVPARKLVLGAAFYGRGWSGVARTGDGLGQPYTGTAASYAYADLAADYVDRNGYRRYWDPAAKAPYLWNAAAATFITYDDAASLRHKAAFVKERGLGGVMYWEHSHDPSQALLGVLHRQLRP